MEYGIKNMKYELWNLEYKTWNNKCGSVGNLWINETSVFLTTKFLANTGFTDDGECTDKTKN